MLRIFILSILSYCAICLSDVDVPSNVAVRSVGVKGTFLCGKVPYEGARIRLYRTQQFTGDDIRQIVDEKVTYISGRFQVEGNTAKFPKNETEFEPWMTVHHTCEQDSKKLGAVGYRRFNIRIPDEYVTRGKTPNQLYDLGTLNIELGVPGEVNDKSYIPNPNADLKPIEGSPDRKHVGHGTHTHGHGGRN